ncbi:MAG: hypothetical protein Q4G64_07475 [bacterium]|nr:hypothetical protein [bacterium]
MSRRLAASALLAALVLAGCSPSIPDGGDSPSSEPVTESPTTAAPTTPAPSPEPVEPNPVEDVGSVTASFGGEELDMTGAVVACEIELPRVAIVITQASAPGQFWTTLWSTDLGVDVIDLGIGYGGGEGQRVWRKDQAQTEMDAELVDGAYVIEGETSTEWADESGTTLDVWPVAMTITCPAE